MRGFEMKCFAAFAVFVSVLSAYGGGDAAALRELLDAAAASPGKTAKLSGEYFLDGPVVLNPSHSGLKIDGGGTAAICGGRRVSGWKRDGRVWRAKVGLPRVDALFVDGRRARVAQTEEIFYFNSPYYGRSGPDGKPLEGSGLDAFTARLEDLKPLADAAPGGFGGAYIDVYAVWHHVKCPVEAISENHGGRTASVFVKNPMPYSLYKWETAPRFRICNLPSLLDSPGEFHFDSASGTLSYIPRAGEDMESAEVFVPLAPSVLEICGDGPGKPVSGISITGVKFAFGAHVPQKGWRQSPQASSSTFGLINAEYARGLEIRDCEIGMCNTYAVAFKKGVTDSSIEDCVIRDSGSGGIRIGAASGGIPPEGERTGGVRVKNNIICGYGRYDHAGVGIAIFNCGNNSVEDNAIFDGHYTGISVGWTWGFAPTLTKNNRIANNRIFAIGRGLMSDMGGIYTLGDAEGSVISGNEIYDVRRHRYGGWGIYNDEGSQKWLVEKNYVHDTDEDGYFEHYGRGNTVQNNVFAFGRATQVGLGRQGPDYPDSFTFKRNIVLYSPPASLIRGGDRISPENARFERNLYWNTGGPVLFGGLTFGEWQKTGQDAGSAVADPRLEGCVPQGDAHLKIGFEPFSTASAGVKGAMVDKFRRILESWDFSPEVSMPPEAPWDLELCEDLSAQIPGSTPTHLRVDSIRGGRDVAVLEEGGRRFIRYTDSPCDGRPYVPTGYYTVRISGGKVSLSFDFRVNSRSTFFVEARGEGSEVGGPAFWVRKGALDAPGEKTVLPEGEWLRFEGEFEMGKDAPQSWKCRVFDGDSKLVASFSTGYHKGPIRRMTTLVVSSMSNEEGDTFDIANIRACAAE